MAIALVLLIIGVKTDRSIWHWLALLVGVFGIPLWRLLGAQSQVDMDEITIYWGVPLVLVIGIVVIFAFRRRSTKPDSSG